MVYSYDPLETQWSTAQAPEYSPEAQAQQFDLYNQSLNPFYQKAYSSLSATQAGRQGGSNQQYGVSGLEQARTGQLASFKQDQLGKAQAANVQNRQWSTEQANATSQFNARSQQFYDELNNRTDISEKDRASLMQRFNTEQKAQAAQMGLNWAASMGSMTGDLYNPGSYSETGGFTPGTQQLDGQGKGMRTLQGKETDWTQFSDKGMRSLAQTLFSGMAPEEAMAYMKMQSSTDPESLKQMLTKYGNAKTGTPTVTNVVTNPGIPGYTQDSYRVTYSDGTSTTSYSPPAIGSLKG